MSDTPEQSKASAPLFSEDKKPAMQAMKQAQFIAFAPYVFQASVLLRDKGILKVVEGKRAAGCTIDEVMAATGMSRYAVRVLMEAGLGIELLHRRDGKYYLSKTGHIFLNHDVTRINTNFMRDVCYPGVQDLEASLADGKPYGLRHLGDWNTIFQGLPVLPEPARGSWSAFDHYASDHTFPEALPIVFENAPKRMLDVGANIGTWTVACLQYNPEIQMGLLDLPVLMPAAKSYVAQAGFTERVAYYGTDLLDKDGAIPEGYDTIWLCQFFNCFAEQEIISILQKCYDALPADGRIFINETFWNKQRYEPAAFSLQMASLYFTSIANGNSQMYDSEVYLKLISETGFTVVREIDNVGMTHTILELKKK